MITKLHSFSADFGLDRRRMLEAYNDAAKNLSRVGVHNFAGRTVQRTHFEIDAACEMVASVPTDLDHDTDNRKKVGGTKVVVDAYTEGDYWLTWSLHFTPRPPDANIVTEVNFEHRAWPVINGQNIWTLQDNLAPGYPWDRTGSLQTIAMGTDATMGGMGVVTLLRGRYDGYIQFNTRNQWLGSTIKRANMNLVRIVR